jgi:hypothetical protein
MNLQEPVFTREYDAFREEWYARTVVSADQVRDTDLESLADDFGQGFTRYYSLKVLSEAKQGDGKVCLVFKGQDDDPCAILPCHVEPSMLEKFAREHDRTLDWLAGRVLANMNHPNP